MAIVVIVIKNMAQHIPIKAWISESWYPEMIKEIQKIVSETTENAIAKGKVHYASNGIKFITVNKNIEILPDDYKTDDQDYRILCYRPAQQNWEMLIDNENPHIRVNQCSFEIHLNKDNKINEVYVPL